MTLYGFCMECFLEGTKCCRISLSRAEILHGTIIRIIMAPLLGFSLEGRLEQRFIGPFNLVLLDSTRAFEIFVSEEHFLFSGVWSRNTEEDDGWT